MVDEACSGTTPDDVCAGRCLVPGGRRLYRPPLDGDELKRWSQGANGARKKVGNFYTGLDIT